MNSYKVTIPVTFALAAPSPREASIKCLEILMQLSSELFEHDILLDWGETDAQEDDEEASDDE